MKFEYQGHWVKVMCKNDYLLISTCYFLYVAICH